MNRAAPLPGADPVNEIAAHRAWEARQHALRIDRANRLVVEGGESRRAGRCMGGFFAAWLIIALSGVLVGAMLLSYAGQARYWHHVAAEARV